MSGSHLPKVSTPSSRVSEVDAAPVIIGNYRLIEQLAIGGSAVLQRARPLGVLEASADVVLKRLRIRHRDGRARLLREGHVGLGLSSPYLVRILELQDAQELFLVMQNVEGASLRTLLARSQGSENLRFVIPVLVDALRALSALHHWKSDDGQPSFVVHQAPLARHMLVGVDGITRLIDLSLVQGPLVGPALHLQADAERRALAPEQLSDPARLDPRCDLFIVGRVLWEAISGQPLFATPLQHGEPSHDFRLPPLPASVLSGATCFEPICRRALAVQRRDRYWSADELGYALERVARSAGLYAERAEVAAWVRATLEQPPPARAVLRESAVRVCLPPPAPSLPDFPLRPQPLQSAEPSVREPVLFVAARASSDRLISDDGERQSRASVDVARARSSVFVQRSLRKTSAVVVAAFAAALWFASQRGVREPSSDVGTARALPAAAAIARTPASSQAMAQPARAILGLQPSVVPLIAHEPQRSVPSHRERRHARMAQRPQPLAASEPAVPLELTGSEVLDVEDGELPANPY